MEGLSQPIHWRGSNNRYIEGLSHNRYMNRLQQQIHRWALTIDMWRGFNNRHVEGSNNRYTEGFNNRYIEGL
jgi:hypothetical protein